MTTLSALADRIQLSLNDAGAGTWPQATVEAWVEDGISDYSRYFPRIVDKTVDVFGAAPGHYVELPDGFLELLYVEFPYGEDPPVFLTRRSMKAPGFWNVDGYYDITWELQESEEQAPHPTTPQIVFSRAPTASEGYRINYTAAHTVTGDSDVITVPGDHESLLVLFVQWQAFKERAATHLQDPDTTSDILQKMVNAEKQSHDEYRLAIAHALEQRSQGGWVSTWTADSRDRIY